uniref:Uncharacterized protein n=2 Tax=Cucumis melo TaxID=3656 RepID=A0A9I9DGB4_CUCME
MARFGVVVRLSVVGRHGNRRTDVRRQGEVSTLGLPSVEEDKGKGREREMKRAREIERGRKDGDLGFETLNISLTMYMKLQKTENYYV